uniref:DNA topoisomerase n=1 Tax=Paulinella micropora TaxID=1928728 RepID=A0A385I1C4_9EUKA|nr:DNA topoisomerase I [Paulinella micropora]AXY63650.1 DNA topoisomerase I [Paulinella micropora]
MAHILVIVESPTKARTIRSFLPDKYRVEASMGHVRDLPNNASEIPAAYKQEKWANLGVNIDGDFEPLYVVPKDKRKIVKELKSALKDADSLLLATDEDREGESISWHLYQLLDPKIPTRRMVFHEITQDAILKALEQTRELNIALVHAQETRRILDRLVGYTLSPLLWKKVAWGLSAGRVQSVAVKLIVQREQSRRAFRSGSYWDLKAKLTYYNIEFEAKLTHVRNQRIVIGTDFDETTGMIKNNCRSKLLNEVEAKELAAHLGTKSWQVTQVEEKLNIRKPVAPFTTSTLQQESNRKLRLSARETMRIAQGLYERGFITYMRTDSVNLSEQAIQAARDCVMKRYGNEYTSPEPRQFSTEARNVQEAHEAIRPSGDNFRTPSEVDLDGKDLLLYELIWKRTVASQMADARLIFTTVDLEVDQSHFRAYGKRIDFAGFFQAYVEGNDDPEGTLEGQEILLPPLKGGDQPKLKTIKALMHETQPPARYTEAALVKILEKEGIGRPSTYASIIGTIMDRGYANLKNNAFIPSFTGFAVTSLLKKYFPDLVDTQFTAKMEDTLDEISNGKVDWLPYLKLFYRGKDGLEQQVLERAGDIDPGFSRVIDLEGIPCLIKVGRFGAYIESKHTAPNGTEDLVKATLPQEITPADLDAEKVASILKQKVTGPENIGKDIETGEQIYLLFGQYGPYVQRGQNSDKNPKPKRAALPKGIKPEEVTLDDALGLLRLPRSLGLHPDGGLIQAGSGRFGPYIVHDQGRGSKEYRSLKSEDNVLNIKLSRALEILATPKRSRSGRTILKDLGVPEGNHTSVQVLNGPYGLYIKQGKVKVSLPEGKTAGDITLEEAIILLNDKSTVKNPVVGRRNQRRRNLSEY